MKLKTNDISKVALFTAIMAVFSQISIPIPISPIPITLSLFAVFMTAALLDKKRSVLVQTLYVLLGLSGAPVFQGFMGGFNKVFGPTGGYIIAYIPMSFLMGTLIQRYKTPTRRTMVLIMLAGLALCYLFGTAWLILLTKMSPQKAIYAAVLPFIPLDIAKAAAATALSHGIRKRVTTAEKPF